MAVQSQLERPECQLSHASRGNLSDECLSTRSWASSFSCRGQQMNNSRGWNKARHGHDVDVGRLVVDHDRRRRRWRRRRRVQISNEAQKVELALEGQRQQLSEKKLVRVVCSRVIIYSPTAKRCRLASSSLPSHPPHPHLFNGLRMFFFCNRDL